MSKSGTPQSSSHYTSMADRGRMQVETGMARIFGDPDPHAGNVPHNEPGRVPQSTAGTFGSNHTTGTGPGTGFTSTVEHNHYGRGNGVGNGVGRGASGRGTDDEYGQPGAQNLEQQPAIDRNTEMGPGAGGRGALSPNRRPQDADPEEVQSSTSQAGGTDNGYGQPAAQNFEQQPAIDRNTEMGPGAGGKGALSPNRRPQDADPEEVQSSTSQAGALTPAQQRMGRDFPPEVPPRPQAQPLNHDQREQMYQ